MKTLPLLLCVTLGLLAKTSAQTPFPVFNVPRVDDIRIDGDLTDWDERGLRIETFYPTSQSLTPEKDYAATARVAWNEAGLLLGFRIRDDRFVESPFSKPWSHDSIEIFLAAGPDLEQQAQLIVIPGMDPDSGADTRPTVRKYDRRADRSTPLTPPAALHPTKDGYTLEVRIPAEALRLDPRVDEPLALNLQFNDRDRGEGGERSQWTWFTHGWAGNGPDFMHRLHLAEEASAPSEVVAGSSLSPDFRAEEIFVVASSEQAGATVRVYQGETTVRSTTLTSDLTRATARMTLPLPSDPDALPFEVRIKERLLHRFDTATAHEKRMKAVREATWEFPGVFFSDALPQPAFQTPGWIHTLTGGYELKTTYYDADYNEVDTAATPGRYGAVTVLTTEDAPPMRFYHTLYRARGTEEDTLKWEDLSIRLERLPESLGFPEDLLARQAGPVSRFLFWDTRDLLTRKRDGALIFAALDENGPDPMHMGTDPWSRDQGWWLGLKKKLGLFEHRYHVDLPEGYADPARGDETWPLILFLHGAGERGDDPKPTPKHGPSRLIREGESLPFIVVSPQCENGQWWNPPRVMDVLDEVKTMYRIDEDRIYLTGLSMGGYGSWDTALAHPDVFAAVAPICGGGIPEEASRLVNVPIWNFHGEEDGSVPFRRSVDMVEAIRAAGGEAVAFTSYPGVGHNAWSITYENPDLYAWFLRNRRGAPAVRPEQLRNSD